MQKRHNDPNFIKIYAITRVLFSFFCLLRLIHFDFDSIQIFIHSFVAERYVHGMAWLCQDRSSSIDRSSLKSSHRSIIKMSAGFPMQKYVVLID